MKTWIFIGILISILCGGAYYYYTTTQNRIELLVEQRSQLESNNRQLIRSNEENLDTISELQRIDQENRLALENALQELQSTRINNDQLRQRLGRHELGALAAARPGLVERVVNNASQNALRCFEVLSGSPLTERELNAATPREANSECPWLFER
jgi:hypothetical protein